jgi:hypothetical protein
LYKIPEIETLVKSRKIEEIIKGKEIIIKIKSGL